MTNIQGLCQLSEEKLASILGNAASAKQLWEFIHTEGGKQTKTQQVSVRHNTRKVETLSNTTFLNLVSLPEKDIDPDPTEFKWGVNFCNKVIGGSEKGG